MARQAPRKLKWTAITVFSLFFLILISWFIYHAWPKQVPEPLYSFSEFAVSTPAKDNAWGELERLKRSDIRLKLPSDHDDLALAELQPFEGRDEAYWERVLILHPKIRAYFQTEGATFQQYLKVFRMPVLLDESQPQWRPTDFKPVELLELRRAVNLYLSHLMAEGQSAEAYELWRELYIHDLSFQKSARALLTHLIAASLVQDDLLQLRRMLARQAPENREEWLQWLRTHPPVGGDLRRTMRFEYFLALHGLAAAKKEMSSSSRLLWNEAWIRQQVNDHFARIEKVLKGPQSLWFKKLQELDAEAQASNRESFWWLSNPMGKSVLSLLYLNNAGPAQYYLEYRTKTNELFKQVTAALTAQAVVETPADQDQETSPVETPESAEVPRHPATATPEASPQGAAPERLDES